MKLNFIKANPTENMTVFILDPLPRSTYKDVAKKIMAYSNINAEQVGFIEKPSKENSEACARLHMMGDEFCGNATRACAAILVQREYFGVHEKEGKFTVPLEVSGVDEVIYCEVEFNNSNSYTSNVNMPLHKSIKDISIEYKDVIYNGTLVEFPGITHLIVNGEGIKSREEFFMKVKEELNGMEYDALGIMFYNEEKSYIEPLVYVASLESLVWERGCGSGATALGVVVSYQLKKGVNITVNQPGGQLEVCTKCNENNVDDIYLKGIVDIVSEGIVYV